MTEGGLQGLAIAWARRNAPAPEAIAGLARDWKTRLERALAAHDLSTCMALQNRSERWQAFRLLAPVMSDAEYWHHLSDTYRNSETLWQEKGLRRLFAAKRGKREAMMTAEERATLRALPEVITVYRGCLPHNRAGWSWTMDQARAESFARRWDNAGIVLEGTVEKSRVIALLRGGKEDQLVCDPLDIRLSTTASAVPDYPPPPRELL